MADLEYNVNVTVEGKEDVDELATDIEKINENTTINVDATGVTETAEGLESIETSGAAGTIDDIGVAAGTASGPVGGLGSGFNDMVTAIGLYTIASTGAEIIMGQIRGRLDYIAETKAWDAAQVEAYKAAVEEVGAGLEAVETKLRDAGEFLNPETSGLFGIGGGSTTDAAVALGLFGFTVDDVSRAIRGGDEALDGFENQLEAAGLGGDTLNDVMGAVRDEADAYSEATNGAAARTAFFAESAQSANDKLTAMLDQQEPMRRFTEEWDTLVNGLRDGSIDTQTGADALNTLSQELGLTTEEVLALAQAQVDEGVAGAEAYAEALGSIDFQNTDIDGATSAFAGYTAELFAAGNETQRVESAYAAMATAVGDGTLNLNTATESGRAQQDALEGVAAVLDGQLAQAYDNADGSQADFAASATKLGDETLARLQADLGLTDGQVNVLRETLGLTAADYEARFELAGVAEAQLQLGLLQGAIGGLSPEVELRVNTLIAQGEYVAARDEVAAFYAGNPVPLPAEADTEAAEGDLAAVAEEERTATVTAQAETAQAAADLLDEASRVRLASILAIANTSTAGAELDRLDDARTVTINAEMGFVPSASAFRNAVGAIRIPIQAYWNTRIEGNRPV